MTDPHEEDVAIRVGRVFAVAVLGGAALVILAGCIYVTVWILAKVAGITA